MENFPTTTPSASNRSAISVASKRLSIFSRIHTTLDKAENSGNPNQRVSLRHSSVSTSSDFSQLDVNLASAVASGRRPDTPAVGIPPPSPSCGQGPGGNGGGGGRGGGNSVMKLLDDLHHSRIRIEQDQREYQKVRGEIGDLDKKIVMLELETEKSDQKWNSLTETGAGHKTKLKSIEIKNKVYDGTLKSLAEELASSQQELHQLRISAMHMSSTFLLESIDFASTWNGSELGHNNRVKFQQDSLEELLREQRQLEYELTDFLGIRKGLEESQADVDDLEREYKEFDDIKTKKEKEVQELIDEYDMALKDLENENEELVRSSEAEYEKLKGELEETQETVRTLETTSNNTKVMVKTQQAPITTGHQQNSEEQDENNSSMINVINDSSSNQQFDNSRQSKPNLSRFQVPIKTQIPNNSRPQSSVQTFSNEKNDDDFVETSPSTFTNNVRTYDPMTPSTSYTSNCPPCKVRVVERQTPITSFMKQLSSNMKRPPRKNSTSTRKNVAVPVQAPIPKGKIFNFKKKTSTASGLQNESYNTSSDSLNSPLFANSSSSVEPICAEESNDSDRSFAYSTLDDRPFSCFNPSRVLLSESQQLLLLAE